MNGNSTQGFLNFSAPAQVPTSNIDTRGWRRLSVATGRCVGKCSDCTCVSDLQILARFAVIEAIVFNESGSPVLTPNQIIALRAKKELATLNETTDTMDIVVSIPPAPLSECRDDEL